MIDPNWGKDLHAYVGGTVRGLGATPFAVGGVADHVHVLAGLKATHNVADLVREVKKASSIWGAQRYHQFAWQAGYGAFSVGSRDLDAAVAYVNGQEEHHRTISSAEELRLLLAEHGVPLDERFFE